MLILLLYNIVSNVIYFSCFHMQIIIQYIYWNQVITKRNYNKYIIPINISIDL